MNISNASVQTINASIQALVQISKSIKHSNQHASIEIDEVVDNITNALCDVD